MFFASLWRGDLDEFRLVPELALGPFSTDPVRESARRDALSLREFPLAQPTRLQLCQDASDLIPLLSVDRPADLVSKAAFKISLAALATMGFLWCLLISGA